MPNTTCRLRNWEPSIIGLLVFLAGQALLVLPLALGVLVEAARRRW